MDTASLSIALYNSAERRWWAWERTSDVRRVAGARPKDECNVNILCIPDGKLGITDTTPPCSVGMQDAKNAHQIHGIACAERHLVCMLKRELGWKRGREEEG